MNWTEDGLEALNNLSDISDDLKKESEQLAKDCGVDFVNCAHVEAVHNHRGHLLWAAREISKIAKEKGYKTNETGDCITHNDPSMMSDSHLAHIGLEAMLLLWMQDR